MAPRWPINIGGMAAWQDWGMSHFLAGYSTSPRLAFFAGISNFFVIKFNRKDWLHIIGKFAILLVKNEESDFFTYLILTFTSYQLMVTYRVEQIRIFMTQFSTNQRTNQPIFLFFQTGWQPGSGATNSMQILQVQDDDRVSASCPKIDLNDRSVRPQVSGVPDYQKSRCGAFQIKQTLSRKNRFFYVENIPIKIVL